MMSHTKIPSPTLPKYKFYHLIIFLTCQLLFLLTPSASFAQSKTYSNNTTSGYQRINPQTGEFQPIPPRGVIYDPNNPIYINPSYQLPAIKQRLNLWIDIHHLEFLRNLNIVRLIFSGIAVSCLSIIGLILFIRYLLFKKNLIKQEGEKVFLSIKVPSQTAKLAYSTQQLFEFIHSHYMVSKQPFWKRFLTFLGFPVAKQTLSLEIVSTKEDGIRYFIQTNKKDVSVLEKTILSYITGVRITRDKDYLPEDIFFKKDRVISISEYKLSNHFSLPLQDLKTLEHYDPIAYITGHMTKLEKDEMISMQVVLSPIASSTHPSIYSSISELKDRIWKELKINDLLYKAPFLSLRGILLFPLQILVIILLGGIYVVAQAFHLIIHFFVKGMEPFFSWPFGGGKAEKMVKTPKEELLYQSISSKIDGSLFEGSIRLFVAVNSSENNKDRVDGFTDSLSPFANPSLQSITIQRDFSERFWTLFDKLTGRRLFYKFLFFKLKHRLLSFNTHSSPIFSVSEISDLYHPPYTDITKTEGLIKSRSGDLPAPLSMKQSTIDFDVLIGKNLFGGEVTPIGLTLPQRRRHTYVIGKTGMGKTEMIKNMILQDMINGKGLAVLDPHGDLIQDLLKLVPESRIKDVIYFDPSDRDNPIGLNILSPGIKFINDEEREEKISSSIIAIFQKLTPEEYWGPRMEHILRNTTLTALQTEIPTLWTLQQLLTDKDYQRKVSAKLTDPILKQFWDKEFANVGKMQMFSVTAPLTERLGLFITTKMSRHILLQEVSTISIQKIMDEDKIFLVNLSKGDLGEDQSFFFGTMITSFIWMAAYQRRKIPEGERLDFILYVDEFQNFATKRFAEISSESRKFHVSLIVSHQNIAQIEDPHIITIVAGNADTIIALKAGPDDEKFILPFMDPEVKKGDIVNLAPFHFFMKVTTDTSEEAFSGETELLEDNGSNKVKDEVISYSRKHYATPRKDVEAYLETIFTEKTSSQPKTAKPKDTTFKSRETKKPRKKSW